MTDLATLTDAEVAARLTKLARHLGRGHPGNLVAEAATRLRVLAEDRGETVETGQGTWSWTGTKPRPMFGAAPSAYRVDADGENLGPNTGAAAITRGGVDS